MTNSRLGIGTTSPSYKLHVNGNVSGISIYASDDITAFSDARIKGKIKLIENSLEKVKQISGITFVRTDEGHDPTIRKAGVLAQEVEKVLPEVVNTDPKTGIKSVAYGNMSGLLIEAIKELSNKIDDIQTQINNLKNK
jgi:hypothetical protein